MSDNLCMNRKENRVQHDEAASIMFPNRRNLLATQTPLPPSKRELTEDSRPVRTHFDNNTPPGIRRISSTLRFLSPSRKSISACVYNFSECYRTRKSNSSRGIKPRQSLHGSGFTDGSGMTGTTLKRSLKTSSILDNCSIERDRGVEIEGEEARRERAFCRG